MSNTFLTNGSLVSSKTLASAADNDHGRNGPKQQYWHFPLLPLAHDSQRTAVAACPERARNQSTPAGFNVVAREFSQLCPTRIWFSMLSRRPSGFWLNTLHRVHAGIQMRRLTCFYFCSTGAMSWPQSIGCDRDTGCTW